MLQMNLSPSDKPSCGSTSVPSFAEIKECDYTLWIDIYELLELYCVK